MGASPPVEDERSDAGGLAPYRYMNSETALIKHTFASLFAKASHPSPEWH